MSSWALLSSLTGPAIDDQITSIQYGVHSVNSPGCLKPSYSKVGMQRGLGFGARNTAEAFGQPSII